MDFMRQIAKRVHRERWGKGLCVVTRDERGRLNLSTFATVASAQEYLAKLRYWEARPDECKAKFGTAPSRVVVVR